MKKCTKCGEVKPLEAFRLSKNGKFGLMSICRECYNKRAKDWNDKNKQKVKDSQEKYRINNLEKYKERGKKYKATKKKWKYENPEKVIYYKQKQRLKKQIGEVPPPELVEVKVLINKTIRLCKTSKNLETI